MRSITSHTGSVLLGAVILLAAAIGLPHTAFSQEYPDDAPQQVALEPAKAGPPQGASGLLQSPPRVGNPRVAVQTSGTEDYRPPVEPPVKMPVYAPKAGSRPQPSTGAVPNVYVVQPGDTPPAIAKKVLGNMNRWQELMAFNQIGDPNSLRAGQRLVVPSGAGGAAQTVKSAVASGRGNAPSTMEKPAAHQEFEAVGPEEDAAPAPVKVAAGKSGKAKKQNDVEADASYYGQSSGVYTVQRGDTLAKIAKKLMGSTKRWRELARSNPQINPNRLIVGQTLVVPGLGAVDQGPTPFAYTPSGAGVDSSFDAGTANPSPSIPSYEPPPLTPPPAPSGYGNPAASSMMVPPSAPRNTAPMAVSPQYTEAPPPPPYVSGSPIAAPAPGVPVVPVPVVTNLYREEKYRIPDELKPTDYSPYYANYNGYYGLFETESALIPYINTWHFGFHFRYDHYQYLNGYKSVIDGRQWMAPINLLYTGHKLYAGVTIPIQGWEVTYSGLTLPKVALNGLHDIEAKVGYQIWKNFEGTHAVTLHLAGKFPGDNYHQPLFDMSGKTRLGVRVGPANATRGAWAEFGGAYTGRLNDRWTSHINLALANDSEDSIAKYIYRGGLDYRVNQHFSLVGELNGNTWEMDGGPDGANTDMTIGAVFFNESWQFVLGFPYALQSHWGYGHDFGVTCGLNTRWD